MAYVFGKLNNLIGQNDQGQDQGNPQNLVKRGGGDPAASASSGDVKGPDQFAKSTFQSAGAIIDRNKNVDQGAAANRIAAPATQRLNQDFEQIQKDRGSYEGAQSRRVQDTYKPVSQEIVEQGVRRGDNNAYNALQRSLNPESVDIESFQTITPRSNSEIQSLAQGDTSRLLQQRAGGPYTAGMAALDSLSFQKSGGAAQVASQLGGLQNRNRNALQQARDLESQYQGQADRARDFLKTDTGSRLQGLLGNIRSPLEQQASQLTQSKRAQEQALKDQYLGQFNQRVAPLDADIQTLDAMGNRAFADQLRGIKNNPNNFVRQQTGREARIDDVISQQDADAVNRLNALLGIQGPLVAPSQFGNDYSTTYDPNALNNTIDSFYGQTVRGPRRLTEQEQLAQATSGGLNIGIQEPEMVDYSIRQIIDDWRNWQASQPQYTPSAVPDSQEEQELYDALMNQQYYDPLGRDRRK